jgi:hypothetical protein
MQERMMAAEKEKVGVATRLFINGHQIGSDSTYMDYYPSVDLAVADTRTFYEGEGYKIHSLELENLPCWPDTDLVPTVVVRAHRD